MIKLTFALLFLSSTSYSVELKSLKEIPNKSTLAILELNCHFKAKTTEGKIISLKVEKFLLAELKHEDENKRKGVYVNLFDFLGYGFHLDKNNKLIILVEKEETEKKIIKQYSRLPLALITKVNFSTNFQNKSVNFKEVSAECE